VRSPGGTEVRSPSALGSAVSEGTRKCGLREEREVRSPRGKGSAVSERGGSAVVFSSVPKVLGPLERHDMCPRSHKGQEKSSHVHSIDNESPQVHSVDTRHLPPVRTSCTRT
jgi:hypothetical protein